MRNLLKLIQSWRRNATCTRSKLHLRPDYSDVIRRGVAFAWSSIAARRVSRSKWNAIYFLTRPSLSNPSAVNGVVLTVRCETVSVIPSLYTRAVPFLFLFFCLVSVDTSIISFKSTLIKSHHTSDRIVIERRLIRVRRGDTNYNYHNFPSRNCSNWRYALYNLKIVFSANGDNPQIINGNSRL